MTSQHVVDLMTATVQIPVYLQAAMTEVVVDLQGGTTTHVVDLQEDTTQIAVYLMSAVQTVDVVLNPSKPNILLILLDDCGVDMFGGVTQYETWLKAWAGLPPSGGPGWPDMQTIQAMANEGVVFTEARSYPNCSPARACWHTGRYGFRTGVGTIIGETLTQEDEFGEFSTAPSSIEYILPNLLQDGGYRCGIFGKWHLALPDGGEVADGGCPWGASPPGWFTGSGWSHATDLGWDIFRGTFRNLYIQPYPPDDGPGGEKLGYYNYYWYDSSDDTVTQTYTYHTLQIREELQDWILNMDGGEPWFACWSLSALHSPFGDYPDNGGGTAMSGCMPPTTPSKLYWSSAVTYDPDISNAEFIWDSCRAALEGIDFQIDALKTALGSDMWDRTVVIVMGDNGTDSTLLTNADISEDWGTYSSTVITPQASKNTVYEAGIRVPLIVRGPVVGGAARTSDALVDMVDLFQTIRVIAGVSDDDARTGDKVFDSQSFHEVLWQAAGTTGRYFSFSEQFSPNGSPVGADVKKRAYSLWFDNTGVAANNGLFKVVRLKGAQDVFYRISDGNGAPIDPYEQSPLSTSHTNAETLTNALNALLISDP